MRTYIFKRIFAGILTLFVLITLSFFLMHAIPGGPFSHSEDRNVPDYILEKVADKFGLNDPLYVQYLRYVKGIVKGDLGFSFVQKDVSVNTIVSRGFPSTAKVGMLSALFSVAIGVGLGIISAVKRGKWQDWLSMLVATIGISIPVFVIAVLLMYLFCGVLKILPNYGLDTWKHYILPVAGLSLANIAQITRLMRSSMLEEMRQDYIRTARAKGVSEFFVVAKHGLRNAMVPVVTYLGPMIAGLLTGSFVIEKLFSIPGIGREYVTSIANRDYSVLLGMTVFFGSLVVICNLIVDILYMIIDPRVKIEK